MTDRLMIARLVLAVLLVSSLLCAWSARSSALTNYTPLELDALLVQKTGLAGMDWFVHNKIVVSASLSGRLTPIPVFVGEKDWGIVDGTVGGSGRTYSLPNLKTAFFPNAEYLWIDSKGDVKARNDMGYSAVEAAHIISSFTMSKLTDEGISISMNDEQVAIIPASTSYPAGGRIGELGKLPIDWYYPGSGWPEPANDIRGSQTGPLADVAARIQYVEHQIVPHSENYAGDFLLENYFAFGDSSSQVYLFTAKLAPVHRCLDSGCPLYADTHGTLKLTIDPDGGVTYFLVRGPAFPVTVKYDSAIIYDFKLNAKEDTITGSLSLVTQTAHTTTVTERTIIMPVVGGVAVAGVLVGVALMLWAMLSKSSRPRGGESEIRGRQIH